MKISGREIYYLNNEKETNSKMLNIVIVLMIELYCLLINNQRQLFIHWLKVSLLELRPSLCWPSRPFTLPVCCKIKKGTHSINIFIINAWNKEFHWTFPLLLLFCLCLISCGYAPTLFYFVVTFGWLLIGAAKYVLSQPISSAPPTFTLTSQNMISMQNAK